MISKEHIKSALNLQRTMVVCDDFLTESIAKLTNTKQALHVLFKELSDELKAYQKQLREEAELKKIKEEAEEG